MMPPMRPRNTKAMAAAGNNTNTSDGSVGGPSNAGPTTTNPATAAAAASNAVGNNHTRRGPSVRPMGSIVTH